MTTVFQVRSVVGLWVGMCAAGWWAGGCGRVTVEPDPGDSRGGAGAGGTMTVAACDTTTQFAAPVAATEFNSDANDDGLSFSSDGLTAYVSSARGGDNYDIFVLTRASTDKSFGPATAIAGGINTADQDRDPHVSHDGLKLYYFSNHGLPGTFDLFVATRASLSASFGAGVPLTALNSAANEYNPFPASDDQVLYFVSDRAGGAGGTDIYRGPLTPTTAAAAATLVSEISTAAAEARPVLSDGGLTLYFDRVGAAGDDIWIANRATVTDPFGPAHAVAELNTAGNDFPIWLSADGCTLYFASDRSALGPGRNTGLDIYMATRPH